MFKEAVSRLTSYWVNTAYNKYNVSFFHYEAWRARILLINDNLTTSYQINNALKAVFQTLQTTQLNFENHVPCEQSPSILLAG